MFRDTARNLQKLRRLARDLDAMVLRALNRRSGLFRVVRDRDGLQLDFMTKIAGIRSFAALRSRASVVRFSRYDVRVASLEDIIRSKAAANRPEDRAVLPMLRRTEREKR